MHPDQLRRKRSWAEVEFHFAFPPGILVCGAACRAELHWHVQVPPYTITCSPKISLIVSCLGSHLHVRVVSLAADRKVVWKSHDVDDIDTRQALLFP